MALDQLGPDESSSPLRRSSSDAIDQSSISPSSHDHHQCVTDQLSPTHQVDEPPEDERQRASASETVSSQIEPEPPREICDSKCSQPNVAATATIELRFLVRRREAGALIGKRGSNIKRLRDTFRSSMFSVPDTGNGPERVVCIMTDDQSIDPILHNLTQMLMEKSPENDNQIEIKLLIHSSHAGSIIGIGGQSIKKLRNDSRAAIKIYEMCCPLSNERVCAIKAKPPVVVSTIKLIQTILNENPIKGTIKPYDALHFDINVVDKYGGFLPEEPLEIAGPSSYNPFGRALVEPAYPPKLHFPVWRTIDQQREPCDPLDHDSTANRQRRIPAEGQLESQRSKQSSGSQRSDETSSSVESNPDKTSPRSATRSPRFHPYQYANNRLSFAPSANRMRPTLRCYPSANMDYRARFNLDQHQAQFRGQQPYARMQSSMSAGQTSRCQHSRPCLCMFLPIMSETTPFVQLIESLNASRHPANAYKKM